MKHVLIFAYYWPPASGPGVQRWLKFCKYLPEFGYQPIVITVANGSYPAMDSSLIKEIPEDVEVIKTKTLEPFTLYNFLRGKKGKQLGVGMDNSTSANKKKRFVSKAGIIIRSNFFIPDARMMWKNYAVKAAKKVISKYDIKAVITTGPPQSVHLTGLKLKELYGVPWVADFRDPWTSAYYNKNLKRWKWAWEKDKNLENKVLKSADAVTVVSPGMHEEFSNRNPSVCVVYNGFDEEDFSRKPSNTPTQNFILQFVGGFKNLQIHIPLWEALNELLQENEDMRNYFKLAFTGNVSGEVKQSLKEAGLEPYVQYNGFVTHSEAIKHLQEANLLFFITSNLPTSYKLVTGKLFEYLASKTPIFAVGVPQGNADEILIKCNRKPMHAFGDKEAFKKTISEKFMFWVQNDRTLPKIKTDEHLEYSRRGGAKKLSLVFNKL